MLLSGSGRAPDPSGASPLNHSFLQALPGFMVALTRDGKLVYVSENVQEYLGLSMVRAFLIFSDDQCLKNWLNYLFLRDHECACISYDTQMCFVKTLVFGVKLTAFVSMQFTKKSNTLSQKTGKKPLLYLVRH